MPFAKKAKYAPCYGGLVPPLLDEKEADFYNLEWYPGEAENMEYHNPTNVVDTSRVLFDQKTRVMGSHESRTKYLKLR